MPTLLNANRRVSRSPDLGANPVTTSPNPIQMGFTQRDFGHHVVPRLHLEFRFDLPPVDMVSSSAL
jgi:hypothetical protein